MPYLSTAPGATVERWRLRAARWQAVLTGLDQLKSVAAVPTLAGRTAQ